MDRKGNPYILYMKSMADRAIRNQKRKERDYIGPDGLLMCGVCGRKRQRYITVPDPSEDDPNGTVTIKVTASCQCEKDAESKKVKDKKARDDLEQIQNLKSISLMDEKFKNATFDRFKVNQYNAKNLKLCKRYATAFDQMLKKNQGLILWGDVGTGKSFAAACIANFLLEHKISVIMTSFIKLLEKIQAGGETEENIISKLNIAKLVILDDLGAERDTDYALEKVYNIVDSRSRKQLPMILTTNFTTEEMMQEADTRYKRIYDRIFETCYPIQFTGPSWRKMEAGRRFAEMSKFLDDE